LRQQHASSQHHKSGKITPEVNITPQVNTTDLQTNIATRLTLQPNASKGFNPESVGAIGSSMGVVGEGEAA